MVDLDVTGSVSSKRSSLAAARDFFSKAWEPAPIALPVIDQDLSMLGALERVSEVCRYTILRLEHALSRGGRLRAWLRFSLAFAAILAIPALLVAPVVTLLLGQFVTITQFVFQAAQNIMYAVVTIIATLTMALVFVSFLQAYLEGSRRRRR